MSEATTIKAAHDAAFRAGMEYQESVEVLLLETLVKARADIDAAITHATKGGLDHDAPSDEFAYLGNLVTPGEWAADGTRIYSVLDPRVTIAHVAKASGGDYSPANAALLAAAPLLLAELRKARQELAAVVEGFVQAATSPVTGLIDDDEDRLMAEADKQMLNGIDAAIAKATEGGAA